MRSATDEVCNFSGRVGGTGLQDAFVRKNKRRESYVCKLDFRSHKSLSRGRDPRRGSHAAAASRPSKPLSQEGPTESMDAETPPFFSSSSWDWKSSGGSGGSLELGQSSPAQSLSPSPSFDSYASSPYPLLVDVPCGPGGGNEAGSSLRGYPLGEFPSVYLSRPGQGQGHKGPKGRMSVQRRRKASEREKLRMRTLAEALHTLRNYLPPMYTQRGQPLTKIQTLKYTIKYIGELTDLLNTVKQGQMP